MSHSDEIKEMMVAFFDDLGLRDASESEIDDLISIHGRALGACALEFQRELTTNGTLVELEEIDPVLNQIRTSSFESPVSGGALIAELADNVSAECLRYLLLTSHLALRASGVRAHEKGISLIDALDDCVVTIGQKATNEWDEPTGDPHEAWCITLFSAARQTAELATGEAFFRNEPM